LSVTSLLQSKDWDQFTPEQQKELYFSTSKALTDLNNKYILTMKLLKTYEDQEVKDIDYMEKNKPFNPKYSINLGAVVLLDQNLLLETMFKLQVGIYLFKYFHLDPEI